MTAPAAALLQERFREALGAVPPEGLALGALRSRIYTRLARVHRDLDEVPEAMTNYMQAVQGLHDAERASSVEFADLNLEYARYGSEVAKSPITTMILPKNQSNKSLPYLHNIQVFSTVKVKVFAQFGCLQTGSMPP